MLKNELPVPPVLYMPKFIFQNKYLTSLEIRVLCYLLYYIVFIEPNKEELNFTNQQLGNVFNIKTKGYISDVLQKLKEYEFIDLKEGYEIKGHIIKIRKSIIEKYKQELRLFSE
jgi:hypothetical protein